MRNVPKLRFKEFNGDWEEKKFDEVFSFLQNNTFSRDCLTNEKQDVQNIHYGDILVKYNDILEIDDKIPYIKKENSLEKFNSESYLKTGDIVIADTAEDFTVGKTIEIYNPEQKKVLSGLHTFSCRTNFDFALGYLGQYLNTEKYHSQLIPLITGIKVSSISKNSIKGTKISFPIIKEQQQKIADFLSSVDKKISITEEKLDLFKDYKKGIMQKIFNQELRFKDSKGNDYPKWEEKRLGELCDICTGKKDTQNKIENGRYPFFVRSQIVERIDSYSYDGEAILTAGDGVGAGKVFHYINGKFDYHQRVYKLSDFKNCLGRFIFEKFRKDFIKEVRKYNTKTSVDSVRMEMITNMLISLPCLEEQQKIADFLSSIDNKIDNLATELEDLKEFKKGLLQQMFV